MIDWPFYNESLVRCGQVLLGFDVVDRWDLELSEGVRSANLTATQIQQQTALILILLLSAIPKMKDSRNR